MNGTETVKGLSTRQNVHGDVESDSDQDGARWLVLTQPDYEEQDKDADRHILEPFENGVGKVRSDHTAVKNEEEPEKTGNQRLFQRAKSTVDVRVVGSEKVHINVFFCGLV